MKKILRLVAIVAAGAFVLTGCSSVNTQPDTVAVQYSGGLSSASFVACKPVSTKAYSGMGDVYYYYPAGQRTYTFADGGESGPMTVVTSDNVTMTLPGIVSFRLATDIQPDGQCPLLKAFHENVGLKYSAYFNDDQGTGGADSGWVNMLKDYVGKQIDRAADQAAKKYTWKALYTNPTAKKEFESEVAATIPEYVKQFAGGDYFTNWSVVLNSLQPPENIVAALNAEQASIAQAAAEKQKADSQVAVEKAKALSVEQEVKSIEQLVKVLGVNGYIQFKAIEDGKITFMPIPQGSSVVVGKP